MTVLAEDFSEIFRQEHRQVRDLLLEAIEAAQERSPERMRLLLGEIAALTGPHFRYEEEALYPLLTGIFKPEYVEQLYGDHDGAIAAAKRLVELAGQASLSEAEADEAVGLLRGILPHVSDCDGLSIMVEVLEEPDVQSVLDARARSLEAGLDLIEWADDVRQRPATGRAA
ncbi:MAG: hemerythrin domain-containing protein [Solirubrobacterales bacterium]